MNNVSSRLVLSAVVLLACSSQAAVKFQEPVQDSGVSQQTGPEAARDLGSLDTATRQRAAETLARLVDNNQRAMVEGYRLQEKNARVRLALDWALYRMGKREALFAIVKDLDSGRQAQAIGYLTQLESPEPLYVFTGQSKPEIQIGLMEVFARIGNEETLGVVKNYLDAPYPLVAKSAKLAEEQITLRLNRPPASEKSRPRRAGTGSDQPDH
jgi:hypothetical protein